MDAHMSDVAAARDYVVFVGEDVGLREQAPRNDNAYSLPESLNVDMPGKHGWYKILTVTHDSPTVAPRLLERNTRQPLLVRSFRSPH